MSGHVVVAHHDGDRPIAWRSGRAQLSSRARPGAITLIPEGHDGDWNIAGPIRVSHVYLTAARLRAAAEALTGGSSVQLLDRVGYPDANAARILEVLSREAALNDSSARLFVEQAIDLLCTQLLRAHSPSGARALPPPQRGLAPWQVRRVISYMREHLDRVISLDELAALVSRSRFHFCTAFRLATGRTPHEWLVSERMRRARELLSDPRLTVTEIALTVGYGTPSSFAASFRKTVGVTPTAFRRAADEMRAHPDDAEGH